MDSLLKHLKELHRITGMAWRHFVPLIPLLQNLPPNSLESQDLIDCLKNPASLKTALLAVVAAATDFRHHQALLRGLLVWLMERQAGLGNYDQGRFRHIQGFAAWRLDDNLLDAYTALHLSIDLLGHENSSAAVEYLGRVWNTFGQIMQYQGRFREARHDLEVALEYRKLAGGIFDKAFTLGNLARVCVDSGDYQAAAQYFQEDLDLIRQLENTPIHVEIQLLSELASCFLHLGKIQEAGDHYAQSEKLAQKHNHAPGLIFAGLGMGKVFMAWKPPDRNRAGEYLDRVNRLIPICDLPSGFKKELEAPAFELAGDLHCFDGDTTRALAAYDKAGRHFKSLGTTVPGELARVLHKEAKIRFKTGDELKGALILRDALGHIDATGLDRQRESIEAELKDRFPQLWMLHAAGRFIGQSQINRLLEQAGQSGFLGQKQEVVVLFSDIRAFTTISEKMAPDELIQMLNDFLTRMTRAIESHGGMVDKFIGDAVMAIFLVDKTENVINQAVYAAMMMRAELQHMNRQYEHTGRQLDIGIGLHCGSVVLGLIGSPQKRSYTVIGDAVNTASRLEGLTKQLGARILLSHEVRTQLTDSTLFLRPLGYFCPKGKTESIMVYDLMGKRQGYVNVQEIEEEIHACRRYVNFYDQKNTSEAINQLALLAELTPDSVRANGYRNIAGHIRDCLKQNPKEKSGEK